MTSTISLLACAKDDVALDRIRVLVGQERSESFTVEHKEKFSLSLVKSVAAMANTYGGSSWSVGPTKNRMIALSVWMGTRPTRS